MASRWCPANGSVTIANFDKFVAEESAFSYDVVVEYSRGDQMTPQPTKIRS